MRLRVEAQWPTVPSSYREGQRVQAKIRRARGTIMCVYVDGWLLVEKEDGEQGLFEPADVEPIEEFLC